MEGEASPHKSFGLAPRSNSLLCHDDSPGASSMVGLMLENGPIRVQEDGSIVGNQWSWDKLVDYVFIDQPV